MAQVGIRELLEAGVHFGHQTRRWNPKMRRFIHGENGGIYIIDLLKTEALLEQAQRFAGDVAHRGGTVLFVGTKKQARDSVKEIAEAAGQPYVNHRWLGGLLTNFQTISQRIKRLHDLERYASEGQLQLLPTRERMAAQADLEKLQANLGGVKHMQRPPDAMFVVDLKTEVIAVREAQRLRIPIIGLVDTNCDPDGIDYVIPGNDDAIRACALITKAIGDVVSEGRQVFRAEEEKARQEAEEQSRREQEERARREQEEKDRAEAEARERAAAEAALTQAGEGEPRDVAEAQVAEAVQAAPAQPEGTKSAEAEAAQTAAAEPAVADAPAAADVPATAETPAADARRRRGRGPRGREARDEVAPARPQGQGDPGSRAGGRPGGELDRGRRGEGRGAARRGGQARARRRGTGRAARRGRGQGHRRPRAGGRQRGRRHGSGRGGDRRRRGRERRGGRRRARAGPAGRRRRGRRERGGRRRGRRPRRGQGHQEEEEDDQEEEGRGRQVSISAAQVKELRDRTGAGMMDCKKALEETGGDVDAAAELLRVRLGDKALKMGGREATEGTVQAYIHANNKVGVLIEVDCNTDFVARNDDFTAFARDIALHIAASPATQYITEEDVPEDAKQAELRVFEQQAADKPEQVRGKIAEGKLRKWMEETVLLNQVHVNADKYDGKTIEQLRAELSGTTGENVVIRRFSRFAVGA